MRKNHLPKKARFFTPEFKASQHAKGTHKEPNNGRKRCPVDGKLINSDSEEAIHYALKLSRWKDGAPVRVYDCEHGYGCHLTTQLRYITRTAPQRTLATGPNNTAADKPTQSQQSKPTLPISSPVQELLKNWRKVHGIDSPKPVISDKPRPSTPAAPDTPIPSHADEPAPIGTDEPNPNSSDGPNPTGSDDPHPFAAFRATMPKI